MQQHWTRSGETRVFYFVPSAPPLAFGMALLNLLSTFFFFPSTLNLSALLVWSRRPLPQGQFLPECFADFYPAQGQGLRNPHYIKTQHFSTEQTPAVYHCKKDRLIISSNQGAPLIRCQSFEISPDRFSANEIRDGHILG